MATTIGTIPVARRVVTGAADDNPESLPEKQPDVDSRAVTHGLTLYR
jgi:hypothetical protein